MLKISDKDKTPIRRLNQAMSVWLSCAWKHMDCFVRTLLSRARHQQARNLSLRKGVEDRWRCWRCGRGDTETECCRYTESKSTDYLGALPPIWTQTEMWNDIFPEKRRVMGSDVNLLLWQLCLSEPPQCLIILQNAKHGEVFFSVPLLPQCSRLIHNRVKPWLVLEWVRSVQ